MIKPRDNDNSAEETNGRDGLKSRQKGLESTSE